MNKQCAKLALGRLYGATAFLLQVPLALLAPLAEVINAIGAVALLGLKFFDCRVPPIARQSGRRSPWSGKVCHVEER